jgi:hopanoid biosynthesis associated protein HpnK
MVFEEFDPRIRVIFTADNLGRSANANRAVLRAHSEGLLTSAAIAVKGGAFEDAVALAKSNPKLAAGLLLVLVDGKSVLKPSEIVGLVDQHFAFSEHLYRATLRYLLNPRLHGAIKAEMDAQMRVYRMAGLPLTFVAGRHGFHLHPAAFKHLRRHYHNWHVTAVRSTHDPVLTNLRVAFLATAPRALRGLIYRHFGKRARPPMERRGLLSPDRAFGTMARDNMDEDYLVRILQELHPGTFEFFCQPDETEHVHELEALLSPRVKEVIRQRGIEVISYADL